MAPTTLKPTVSVTLAVQIKVSLISVFHLWLSHRQTTESTAMASNSKWVFLKTARVPTMFQTEAGEFNHLQRSYAKSREGLENLLGNHFGKQKREILKEMERAGLKFHVVIGWNKDIDAFDVPGQISILFYNIRNDQQQAARQFGQNLFDAKAELEGGTNLRWRLKV